MTARARISQLPKPATQSGQASVGEWVLDWEPANAPGGRRGPDPLMGWIGGGDTQAQVRLRFATREEAVAYAERAGLAYDIELPTVRKFRPKAYADNFRADRLENWTH